MNLKEYQLKVLGDLKKYLACVNESDDFQESWQKYWQAQGKFVGYGGIPAYQNKIPRVPHICVKVPTGGGKTFIACAALQPIYQILLRSNKKFVVWLVPSEAILTQTVAALTNPSHPYRQKIEQDFQGNVEVYTKEMLLQAQNFSPTTVRGNISICILSYDSIRSNKKEGRKVYRENGALEIFAQTFSDKSKNLADAPANALINIVRQHSPLVIVDESHNATSELSVEMLKNLNASFILELTATPKSTANIISYVKSRALKAENMVKLPVIVYKKNSVSEVVAAAVSMQKKLELAAQSNQKYIRPIVLLQAQPKNGEESATVDKIQKFLRKLGVADSEIAIKISGKNELERHDLLSPNCKIRYIITIDALKEGWDCPFAYILASVANKNSQTAVEQIVGRILRQPYAAPQSQRLLNLAYVFSCYENFHNTLDRITGAMKAAGFDKDECRAVQPPPAETSQTNAQEELQLETEDATSETFLQGDNSADVAAAIEQAEQFDDNFGGGAEVLTNGTTFAIRENFRESVANLKIPQFFKKNSPNLFGADYVFLEKEHLSAGFNLDLQAADVDLKINPSDLVKIEIGDDDKPFYRILRDEQRAEFISYLESLPPERKIKQCTDAIAKIISDKTELSFANVKSYVKRIVANMDAGQLAAIGTDYPFYAAKIQEKILKLLKDYRKKNFGKWLDTEQIICQKNFTLPEIIDAPKNIDSLQKSLYAAEVSDMNNLERRMVDEFEVLDKVKWWHRNTTREFKLNSYINHFPDFMIMLDSGKIILVETKGEHLDGTDTQEKLSLGNEWKAHAGNNFNYFMVFDNQKIDGACSFNEFLDIVRDL